MYARSYEREPQQTEDSRALPNGYRGVAFEEELPPAEAAIPEESECKEKEASPVSLLLGRLPFLQGLSAHGRGGLFGSFFASTEDVLLLGLFLFLLLSKEGDALCAVAILILFFADKL